jgi:hypothetical protein
LDREGDIARRQPRYADTFSTFTASGKRIPAEVGITRGSA